MYFFLKTPFGTTKGATTQRRARWKRLRTVSPIPTRKARPYVNLWILIPTRWAPATASYK